MPKVSVIMGVYNTNDEKMLKQAIDSILNQTFEDLEFIIRDDGSTDNTFEIVERLTSEDQRVKLLKNTKNIGLAATLNKCLENAQGKYIARMDADDICSLERIEKQVSFLDNNKEYSLVGSNATLFDGESEIKTRKMPEFPKKESFLFNSPYIHPTIMMDSEVYKILGGYRESKETLRCEDYDLFFRLYTLGYKGYNIQENLFKFREDNNAFKRRKFKYRIDEMKVRHKGFKSLKLYPKAAPYLVKPLIVGILPIKVLKLIKNAK
ncbi:glycosyltransferase [Planococcus maritimus]|uniref:Glycosyltransferase n=1 Tax=Planococcus maritimus TaxID=192421 RepID=A0A7D7RDT0_PLAMR|nr:glycosyltransferase [Planococcus maritimus]QMT16760.1 glycosyltransferase [Planococcus maritimus]